jgi:hypothetical protein
VVYLDAKFNALLARGCSEQLVIVLPVAGMMCWRFVLVAGCSLHHADGHMITLCGVGWGAGRCVSCAKYVEVINTYRQ